MIIRREATSPGLETFALSAAGLSVASLVGMAGADAMGAPELSVPLTLAAFSSFCALYGAKVAYDYAKKKQASKPKI